MLKALNSRMTFGARLALLSAVLMAPLVLLTALFVLQSWKDIAFAERELQGVRYQSAIWPEFETAAAGEPESPTARRAFEAAASRFNPSFNTALSSARFSAATTPAARAESGGALIIDVADASNLTLDPALDTFYLMQGTTVRLPELARAATQVVEASRTPGSTIQRVASLAAARGQLEAGATAAEASFRMAHDRAPAETRRTLAEHMARLNSASAALAEAARIPDDHSPDPSAIAEAQQRLQHEIDATWRASSSELARLLQARVDHLKARLWLSLASVVFFLAAAGAVAWSIANSLAVRVRDIEVAMKRLTDGDLSVEIPHRADPGEIGRIAGSVEAFKWASADKARLMEELQNAYATVQEYQSWLKMALAAGRMGAWRRKIPGEPVDLSPEVGVLLGFPPGATPTLEQIASLAVEPETIQRWMDEARRAVTGELERLGFEETVTPFKRLDTGEIRWAMLRREVIPDPEGAGREIVGVAIDITDRKHMMDELNHRVKNNLATVLSLAMQTAKSTEDMHGFMKAFTGRIQALSKINELLTRHGWGEIELLEVLRTALAPWLEAGVTFAPGSPEHTMIGSRAAVSLCLVLHELAANAVQHGALAAEGGRVEVGWSEPAAGRCALRWAERSLHATAPPAGFGATLIERLVSGDLGGKAELDYPPEGMVALLTFDLKGATA